MQFAAVVCVYTQFDTKHVADFSHQEYQQKVNELEGSLGSQESMFEKVTAKKWCRSESQLHCG